MFGGMLAFDVLDRLTGDWSVTNSDWFQGFFTVVIQVRRSGEGDAEWARQAALVRGAVDNDTVPWVVLRTGMIQLVPY